MKNNETGEYELVVGNPQLLSGFFIVALLCGVAFAMGYVVGQNARSAKTAAAQAGVPAAVDANPPVSNPPVQAPPAAPAAQAVENPAPPAAADAEKPAEPPPQPTTQAARETPPPAQAQAPAPDAPVGSYWQVAAFKQLSEAQPIAQTLKDGNMPVVVREGPDGLTHVLVGPYPDTQSLSRAKADLDVKFGIRNPIRK